MTLKLYNHRSITETKEMLKLISNITTIKSSLKYNIKLKESFKIMQIQITLYVQI